MVPAPAASGTPEFRAGQTLPVGTITFLFTDIEGNTPLWERDPQAMEAAMHTHNHALRLAIEAHGGVVFKIVGDEFQVAFPTAPQALAGALAAQRALLSADWNELGPLWVRMGIHTGEAHLDEQGDEYAVGPTKNRGHRVMESAHGGQVLLSQESADLCERSLPPGVYFKDLGEHRVKNLQRLEHLYQVVAPDLQQDFPPTRTQIRPRHNLPRQLTNFIGREAEISQVKLLLEKHPLVTLTGSGGVGKSRLSIRVAQEILEGYADGIWLVELAPISDPNLLPKTVASTLGLREDAERPIQDTLVDFLRNKQMLIILDNCEHLIQACGHLVDSLLSACPQLKFLASSREALGVAGEMAYRVPSMPFPNPLRMPELEKFLQYEAVRLFVERANIVLPGFQLTDKNGVAVIQICKRLDGIPLAIELAAARMSMLTTEQLAQRLDNAFHLLTGGSRTALPRHKTLRATIDWSHNLLSEKERMVLRRLSIFAGSCTLEATEAVCAEEGIESNEVLDLLSSLVSKSILVAERKQGVETRYRLLETVRQYAREKSLEAGESASLRDRHLEYYLSLSEHAEPQLRSAGRLEWSQRLVLELDNLRTALDWAYQDPNRARAGLRMVTAIGFRFLTPNGYLKDALDWVMKGLEMVKSKPDQPLLRARAYNLLAEVYENQRNYMGVLEWTEKSLPILREMGPSAYPDLAWALWEYGNAMATIYNDTNRANGAFDESITISRQMGPAGAWYLGMSLFDRSIFVPYTDDLYYRLVQESRQAFTQSGDRWSIADPLDNLGEFAESKNDFSEALRCFEEASRLSEEVGDQTMLSYMHLHLGRVYRKVGNFDLAIKYHTGYVRLWATMGYQEAMKEGFVNLGLDWFSLGRSLGESVRKAYDQRAVKLIAAAEKQRSTPYTFLYDPGLFDQVLTTTRNEWGEAEFQRVWEEGQSMAFAEAVAFALEPLLIQSFQEEVSHLFSSSEERPAAA
jgi:predicted ATPase/class 3 adenylate cyclase